ncbi:hypothetical protein SAMN04489713_102175 [Actinomadura madurae]|uniref:Uncharacterized protein n=2 Tax=Actinomadura madurae TaxID=1993 RepID=A0A1I4ZF14_9ACTN|nr:hypothetical protein SAMN04489713_102175 [Actinomadura madurae]SPT49783.1 Uncharacterised protein [Actinomadura madurae]
MTAGRSGWTVFCVPEASDAIECMPTSLKNCMIKFFCDFAFAAGTAISSGDRPPGEPQDDAGVAYSMVVDGASVFFDYLVLADIQEFRITRLVWLG